jgi:hypothetical protein
VEWFRVWAATWSMREPIRKHFVAEGEEFEDVPELMEFRF